ncbi:choice-of-anchor D domain-containing protein, partial [Planctomycetota bacterium]|nr:choice-of-anchor D domain-containing protein [Planctomycetota bacterium]
QSVPMTLTQGTGASLNEYVLSGTPATGAAAAGPYTFTVEVTDSLGDKATKVMTLNVVPPPASTPYLDDFSSPTTTWQLQGDWEIGAAVPYTGTGTPARSEPGVDTTPGNTDNRILGHDLGADYALNMTSTVWATSPPVDCSSLTRVSVRFQRWSGVTLTHTAKIQVTNNGSDWFDTSLVSHVVQDSAWVLFGDDITQWAAGHAVVQVRIGIGPTGSTTPNTGWCIDDFQIFDPGPALQVQESRATPPAGPTDISDNEAVGGLRDFGQITTSTNSYELEITLTNNSLSDIDFDYITATSHYYEIVGANPGDFTVTSFTGVPTIVPGASALLKVRFYSTTAGVSTCTINIGHDATGPGTGTTPFEINLRAEAIVPNPILQVDLVGTPNVNVPHQTPATGTPRDFGNVNTGQSSAPISLILTNVGNSDLLIQQIIMDGTWHNQYTISNISTVIPATLSVGQTLTLEVRFQPSSANVKDAFVRIVHGGTNTPGSPTYEVPVTGVGITPTVNPLVSVNDGSGNVPEGAAASGNRDFGNVQIGSSSGATTITVSNTGGGVLTVGQPVLGGPDAGEFSLVGAATFGPTIAVSGSDSFDIIFSPTSVGTKVATVSFTHDDASVNTPFVINITGDGTALVPAMEVHETDAAGSLLATPAPASGILNFGSQDVTAGPSANVAVIYVENLVSATANLTLGTPVFNPTGNTEFSINTGNWSNSLIPGSSASFSITFDPTQSGQLIGLIEFTHNDISSGSPFVLNVTGSGVSPVVEAREGVGTTGTLIPSGAAVVTGDGRDLGSIDVSAGATAAKTITIVNAGTLSLTVGTPTLAGIHAADFTLNTGGMSGALAPAASTSFTVTFDPTVAGMKDAEVRFTHNDTTQPSPFIVRIRGTAVDPSAVQITTLTLPPATLGQVYPTTTMTAIQGAAPYTWSVYSGALPTGLTLSTAGVISGTPTIVGSYTFIIRVTDGGSITNERQYNVVASGAVINLGGGGGNAGCSANTGGSNVWIALLALLAIGAVIFRRKETA